MLQELKSVLDQYEKSYSSSELEKLISRWEMSKDGLLKTLRRHPNYNEAAKAVILHTEDTRTINADTVRTNAYMLFSYVDTAMEIPEETKEQLSQLMYYTNQFIDIPLKEQMDQISVSCQTGQKTSRLLNKLYRKIGAAQLPEYDRLFAKLADSINPLRISRTAVLSVHPCDYLEMSNGTGWRSCHSLSGGEYQAGTLSYMTDEVSMIFYTIHEDYQGKTPFCERKITRQVFAYQDGVLLQSRLYSNNDDISKTQDYRGLVQKIFSECLCIPNLWTLKAAGNVSEYAATHEDARHYPDYEYPCYNPHVSCLKGILWCGDPITIGSESYCVSCGDPLDDDGSVMCEGCDNSCVCTECGARIFDDDDTYYINGDPYCENCVRYCDCCDEYHTQDNQYVSGGHYVCPSCLETHYFWCGHCDEHCRVDEEREWNGEFLCSRCYEEATEAVAV